MTMQASVEPRTPESLSLDPPATDDNTNVRDEERAFGNGGGGTSVSGNGTSYLSTRSSNAQSTTAADEAELQTRASSAAGSSSTNFIKRRTSQMLEAIRAQPKPDAPLPPKLAALVEVYRQSEMAASVRAELEEVAVAEQQHQQHQQHHNSAGLEGNQEMPDIALENSLTRGRKRAGWATQFRILSGRAFKNLYRDPALLATHYISAIALAGEYRCSR